jgi:hypothetical protein
MNATFIDALSYYSADKDRESVIFLEYVLKKYFNDRRFFMPMTEAVPFLEKNDKELFTLLMEEVSV